MKFTGLLPMLLLGIFSCNNPTSPIVYFDVELPGNEPRVFASGDLSLTGRKEGNGTFTPDGKLFFYTQVSDSSGTSIMQMTRMEESWSAPKKASFSDEGENWEPFVTHDGQSLYFISNRSTGEKWNGRIWKSLRNETDWSRPSPVKLPMIAGQALWFPTVSTNGELFFGASLDSLENFGKSDIYVYELGSESFIQNLGPGINTEHEEWDPFIAPDDSYLLFASDRPGGFGKVDTYIAFRVGSGWGNPLNLGESVNSAGFDVAAKVTPDGRYIFFDRPIGKEQDIYWVSARIIAELKRKFYE